MNDYKTLEWIVRFSRRKQNICLKCADSSEYAKKTEETLRNEGYKVLNLADKKFRFINLFLHHIETIYAYVVNSSIQKDELEQILHTVVKANEKVYIDYYNESFKIRFNKEDNISLQEILDIERLPDDVVLITKSPLSLGNKSFAGCPHFILSDNQLEKVRDSVLIFDTSCFNDNDSLEKETFLREINSDHLHFGFRIGNELEQVNLQYRNIVLLHDGRYNGDFNCLRQHVTFSNAITN